MDFDLSKLELRPGDYVLVQLRAEIVAAPELSVGALRLRVIEVLARQVVDAYFEFEEHGPIEAQFDSQTMEALYDACFPERGTTEEPKA